LNLSNICRAKSPLAPLYLRLQRTWTMACITRRHRLWTLLVPQNSITGPKSRGGRAAETSSIHAWAAHRSLPLFHEGVPCLSLYTSHVTGDAANEPSVVGYFPSTTALCLPLLWPLRLPTCTYAGSIRALLSTTIYGTSGAL
jgi:hypothetical protein